MTRGDKYLAAGILFTAILAIAFPRLHSSLFPGGKSSTLAFIKVRGEIVRRIELPQKGRNSTFILHGRLGAAEVEVEGKRIRMKESPCREQICVRQGWIEHAGESIVCIPGEILIHIEGAAPVDAVTR
jgi:hypothetical protein